MNSFSISVIIYSICLFLSSVKSSLLHDGRDSATDFINNWIVQIEGGDISANNVALQLGYTNLGEVIHNSVFQNVT